MKEYCGKVALKVVDGGANELENEVSDYVIMIFLSISFIRER